MQTRAPDSPASGPDAVTLEVFRHLFTALAEEMGASLRRASFSPNIKERRDYSCALFDPSGVAVALGDHMPVHLGSRYFLVQDQGNIPLYRRIFRYRCEIRHPGRLQGLQLDFEQVNRLGEIKLLLDCRV